MKIHAQVVANEVNGDEIHHFPYTHPFPSCVRLETKNHGESKNVAIMTRRNKAFFKPQARLSLIFCGETNPLSPPRGWLIENQTIKETESNGMRPGNLRPNLKLNPLLCELSVDRFFLSVLSTPSDPKHLKN